MGFFYVQNLASGQAKTTGQGSNYLPTARIGGIIPFSPSRLIEKRGILTVAISYVRDSYEVAPIYPVHSILHLIIYFMVGARIVQEQKTYDTIGTNRKSLFTIRGAPWYSSPGLLATNFLCPAVAPAQRRTRLSRHAVLLWHRRCSSPARANQAPAGAVSTKRYAVGKVQGAPPTRGCSVTIPAP
jgi:hypothetical protein